jgi:outer membrane protein assembly factor BamA
MASLMATVPGVPGAAAQRTPVVPAVPLDNDSQQTQAQETSEAQEPERGSKQRKRTGLKGWIRERFEAPPKTTPDAGGGFSPTAGTVVSGSGLAAGARYKSVNLLPGGLDAQVSGMVSLRGYQEYSAAIGWMDRDRSTVALDTADTAIGSLFNAGSPKTPGMAGYVEVRHRFYPLHRYFGVGPTTRREDRSDYTLSGTSVDGVLQRQLTSRLGVSVRGGWLHLQTGAGHDDATPDVADRFAFADLAGLTQQPAFVTMGAGVAWDARTNPRAPEDGWFAATSWRHFAPLSQTADSFTRATIELRGYRRVPGGMVATRGLTSADLGGSATPFFLQASLGGAQTLRGFGNYRFADRAVAHGTVEYRWRVHRYFEITPFVDAGTVAHSWARLAAGDIEVTPGIGLRGRTDHRVLGRVDYSRSREGHRLVLGVGPAF